MFKNISFQLRLVSAFLFIGLLVLIIAVIGWSAASRLSNYIYVFSVNTQPSLDSLWKINEGQTQVQSTERFLMNPEITAEERQAELNRLKQAWEQIEEGFKQYEAAPMNDKFEEESYKNVLPLWNSWKQVHQEFIQLEDKFNSIGIRNPWQEKIKLLEQKQENSLKMEKVKVSLAIYTQMSNYLITKEIPIYNKVEQALLRTLQTNQDFAVLTTKAASQEVSQSSFWVFLGMLIGPFTSVTLGILFSRQIATQVMRAVRVAEEVSTGNLITQVDADSTAKDEISRLFKAFQIMTQNLNALIYQVQQSGIQVTTATTQLSSSGKQLEVTMTEHVASTNEVSATAKSISYTSQELLKTMEEVTAVSQTTTTSTSISQQDLLQMEVTMRQLANATNTIAARLGVISEKANNINNIVLTINKVADQTNLLSFNAAIEAEKAGESGLGFAVVAREIRRLADQTSVATLNIEQMVKQMQSSVSAGVMEMDKFAKEVEQSVEKVAGISTRMGHIIQQVQDLTPRFEAVNQGTIVQSQGAQQISDAMVQLSGTSVQTAGSIREINNTIAQLDRVARGLHDAIARFKIKAESLTPNLTIF